ncbi:MAG: O-antigen ligase family protein [Marinilabiliaceae bacterium]|nr:O-antigen ligase family protein [Marinilabiliaceae bacterium]
MEIPHKRNLHSKTLKTVIIAVLVGFLLISAFFLLYDQLILGIIFLTLPFGLLQVSFVFLYPRVGIITALVVNYFAMGLARYIPGPLGLSVDALLAMTWLAVIFSQFNRKVNWRLAWNGFTAAAIIWYLYALLQFFNPEAISRIAWFYAMRGIALYMVLTIPLVFLAFHHKKDLDQMLKLWAWFTLAGVAKGVMQQIIGPDPWEQQWLAVIGGKTHLLPGGLRIFSFFTDAATYGGSMGYSAVVFLIIALHTTSSRQRLFYALVGIAALYGMVISGTRGALAVPFAGLALYAVLSKQIKMLITGGALMISIFIFLKFTTIGNSVYEIRRFRTGLDPDNPSLMVRKENQERLKVYLADRPFGGGLGSAGNWGLRFSPGTFLAETPTDSWYVQIWAELGRVGLSLHLMILLYILGFSSYLILFKLKSPELKAKAAALLSGMFGIMVASYGSGALGQMPNGLIVYMSMAFIHLMPHWEKEESTSLRPSAQMTAAHSSPENLSK